MLLRNFFDTGILWGDSFLRIAVLWLGMLGALIASRQNNHISINLGLRFLAKKSLRTVTMTVHIFTALICSLVAWYGYNFVLMEYEDAGIAFTLSFANVPNWLTVSIIPIAFTIMALRYFTLAVLLLSGKNFPVTKPDEEIMYKKRDKHS